VAGGRVVLTILVTGVGTPATRGTLYALRKNADQRPVRIIGVDANPAAVGRFMVDQFYPVPRSNDTSYISALLEICRREKVAVVLPQTAEEPLVLSAHQSQFRKEGTEIAVSDHAALEVAVDKWQLLRLCSKYNFAVSGYFKIGSVEELIAAAKQLDYPARAFVIKPLQGCGSKGVHIVKERDEDAHAFFSRRSDIPELALNDIVNILQRSEACPELLAQEHLPGLEYTVDAFIGEKNAIASPRIRQKVFGGTAFETVSQEHPELAEMTLKIGRELGLKYAFGVQYKLDSQGRPKVLECNPRIQGTMVASLFSGANVIWMSVLECLGESPMTAHVIQRPAAFYRFWGGVAFGEGWAEEI
jgi:carbamoyl-phosphate synthase large subunit